MMWLGLRVETAIAGSFCRCSSLSPVAGSSIPRSALVFGDTAMNVEAGGDCARIDELAHVIATMAASAAFFTRCRPLLSQQTIETPRLNWFSTQTDTIEN